MAKKRYVALQHQAVFSGNKAYTLSLNQTGKFRISIVTGIDNGNGGLNWDFKSGTGVSIDLDDLAKLVSICKTLAYIYVNKSKLNDELQKVSSIKMPLVAKTSGNQFGEITVGFSEKENSFAISYRYQNQENANVHDWFTFRPANGNESSIYFQKDGGQSPEVVKTVNTKHLQFANFIRQIDDILSHGRSYMGIVSNVVFNGGGNKSGSYNNNNNNNYNNNDNYSPSNNYDAGDDSIPF